MLIRWAEIYANTEILSPIDLETWQIIARTCRLNATSRVIELASGKGAFATYLAKNLHCRVDCYDKNPDFTDYSNRRAREQGLESKLTFTNADINHLEVRAQAYDAGVCLGALYIFRKAGWKILSTAVKPGGYLAISDLVCKKVPAPREIMEAFFEEPGEPLTLDDARRWYSGRGVRILREIACSQKAWLDYYDLQKEMLRTMSAKRAKDKELQSEVEEELRQDKLVRRHREEYMDYIAFIMQKPQSTDPEPTETSTHKT